MKKKILFFAPNHFNIDKVILTHLNELNEYDIVVLNNSNYKYKNLKERILNFFSKTFLNKKLKDKWKIHEQLNQIKQNAPYDACLFFRPDLIDESILKNIKDTIPSRKAVYWDSFDKIPKLKDTMYYFNDKLSFENDDVRKYNLRLISNFFINNKTEALPNYDAFFFGSHDSRINNLIKITNYLNNKKLNVKALLVGKKNVKLSNDLIEITREFTPFFEANKYVENTKVVIDIAHPNQKGLSMRPYEALGLKRKLITNNQSIKQFDFYNEDNIFVIDDFDNIQIPNSFFEKPFTEIAPEIRNKYHITIWLKNILA